MLKKIILAILVFGCINSVAYGMESLDYFKLHQAINDCDLLLPIINEEHKERIDRKIAQLIELVRANPAMVTAANEFGNTSLHMASRIQGNAKVVSILLEAVPEQQRPAFVMAINEYGNTALHLALRSGDIKIAKLLIEAIPADLRDAFVIARNLDNKTAMHLAEENGHSNVVIEFLVYYRFATAK